MILALAALMAAMSSQPADASTGQYLIHATVIQDGKVLCDPRLTAKAGETAAFVSDNGVTSYALKVVAGPDADHKVGLNGVVLSLDLIVGHNANSRHVATTVVVKPGEPVTLTLPASAASPPVTVNAAADKV